MEDVADLVVTPFCDIVEKGRVAIGNAGDAQPMLKAAQNLVKEGERALKYIEPPCKKQFDEYGSSFIFALKENDDIANYCLDLTNLLWEFDDYVEVDTFDQDKFIELQALSRKAAPKIYDMIMRMTLEAPPKKDIQVQLVQLPSPVSPTHFPASTPTPIIARPAVPALVPVDVPAKAPDAVGRLQSSVGPPPNVEEATAQLRQMMQSQSGPDEGLVMDHQEPAPEPSVEPPPRPPSANPWDVEAPPSANNAHFYKKFAFDRRPPVGPFEPQDDPISPTSPLPARKPVAVYPCSSSLPKDGTPNSLGGRSSEELSSPSTNQPTPPETTYRIFPPQSPRVRNTSANGFLAPVIHENAAPGRAVSVPTIQNSVRNSQGSGYSRQASRPTSMSSNPSSVFDHRRPNGGSIAESERRGSEASATPTSPTLGNAIVSSSVAQQEQGECGLELVRPGTYIEEDGLIPVEMENQTPTPYVHPYISDCRIGGANSFYLQNGFCEGAKDVISGGIGVRKTKKPIGLTTAVTVARCTNTGCMYELDFNAMELDVNGDDQGNLTRIGVGFRVRFLQKSHIMTKRADELLYGCVFCVHQGFTTHPSDATVFFSQKALFQHLARHSRPLPSVPGFTVIEEPEIPENLRNNYDIHFKNPPQAHPAADMTEDIMMMPSATSKDKARRLHGQRLLFDRTPALELMQGARIVGIEWPSQYQGGWAFAWHDGVYATVPTDLLKLDMPPPDCIRMDGTSQTRATAQWRCNPEKKDREHWLKFEKGELITNISWPHPDYWCWWGTNSKGKSGLFPQVFLDTNTLKELSTLAPDRASILRASPHQQSAIKPAAVDSELNTKGEE